MMAIVTDPDFQALIAGDDDIVDPSKASVTAGWEVKTPVIHELGHLLT